MKSAKADLILIEHPEPYIRYINNYRPSYSYVEKERILYDYELMYVMEGSVEMHYGNGIYELQKGDVFYLEPFVRNHIVVEESKHFRTHCIHFDWLSPKPSEDFTAQEIYMHPVPSPDHRAKIRQLQKRPLYAPASLQLPNYITGAPYDRLSSLFAKCYRSFCDKGLVQEFQLKSSFWELLAELAEVVQGSKSQAPIHPQILYAIEFIRGNYTKNLPVTYLAAKYNLSPKYFGTLFKAATGKSVGEFVLELRLYAAREMLLGTNMSIEEIAEKTGFQNPFYFSRCFKMQEKISPSGYRSLMRA